MANYTILSVDVEPACAAGQRHVAKASLLIDRTPGGVAPVTRLLAVQTEGAHLTVAPDGAADEVPVSLVACSCGQGHLLQPEGLVDEYPVRG